MALVLTITVAVLLAVLTAQTLWLMRLFAQVKQLTAGTEQFRRLAETLIKEYDDERKTIARSLHTHFSQQLSLVGIEMAALASRQVPPPVTQTVHQVENMIKELSRDINRLEQQLHPPQLEILGLAPALRALGSQVANQVDLEIEMANDL